MKKALTICKAVKNKKTINDIAEWLEEYRGERDALLWRFGINVGLRLVDILPIRYNDVYNGDGEFKEYLILRESKTKKVASIILNGKIRLHFDRYVLDRPTLRKANGYFFYSRWHPDKPVHKSMISKTFERVEYALALQAFTPHSMRKTFGWHLFLLTRDIRVVQKALNHQSPVTTMLYIGIDQMELDRALRNLSLG